MLSLDSLKYENQNTENENLLINKKQFEEEINQLENLILFNSNYSYNAQKFINCEMKFNRNDCDDIYNHIALQTLNDVKTALKVFDSLTNDELSLKIYFYKNATKHVFVAKVNDKLLLTLDFIDNEYISINEYLKLFFIKEIVSKNGVKSNFVNKEATNFINKNPVITLEEYWNLYPFEKINFFCEYNDSLLNKFINLLSKEEDVTKFSDFTAYKFYVLCSICYKAINLLSDDDYKEAYLKMSSQSTLKLICEEDHDVDAFNKRFKDSSKEDTAKLTIVPAKNSNAIELNIKHIENYYFLSLSSYGFYNQQKLLLMYEALSNEGIEVELPFRKLYLNRLSGSSLLIIDENLNIKECIYDNDNNYIDDQYIGTIEKDELNKILSEGKQ